MVVTPAILLQKINLLNGAVICITKQLIFTTDPNKSHAFLGKKNELEGCPESYQIQAVLNRERR